jgi:hypothetical protein
MRHRKGSFGLVLLALALAFASACAEQREGERCDKQSGNDDCATGLVCTTQSSSSTGSGDQSTQGELLPAVCCPPQGQHATAQICTAGGLTIPEEPDAAAGGAGGAGGASGAGGTAGEAGGGGEAGQGGSTGGEGGAGGSMDTGGGANPDASVKDGG